jgi:hypothetical protein
MTDKPAGQPAQPNRPNGPIRAFFRVAVGAAFLTKFGVLVKFGHKVSPVKVDKKRLIRRASTPVF